MLLTHGRLGLPQLVRFSKLKPRIVRASILVLVQHNLLWHAQSDDEGEVFEMNTGECLMRLRYGRYVWLAEQLYGKAVSIIIAASPYSPDAMPPGRRDCTVSLGPWQATSPRYCITAIHLRPYQRCAACFRPRCNRRFSQALQPLP